MSYFMRYLFTGSAANLEQVEAALHDLDPKFSILYDQSTPESGDLLYGDEVFGEIAFNQRGEQVFDEDIVELRELIEPLENDLKPIVQAVLDNTGAMAALFVLEAGNDNPDILEKLWDWLFSHHPGLLQVDDEGFYDIDGLILPTTGEV